MVDQWAYVTAAYAVTGVGLVALIVFVVLRLRRWSRAAREEEGR